MHQSSYRVNARERDREEISIPDPIIFRGTAPSPFPLDEIRHATPVFAGAVDVATAAGGPLAEAVEARRPIAVVAALGIAAAAAQGVANVCAPGRDAAPLSLDMFAAAATGSGKTGVLRALRRPLDTHTAARMGEHVNAVADLGKNDRRPRSPARVTGSGTVEGFFADLATRASQSALIANDEANALFGGEAFSKENAGKTGAYFTSMFSAEPLSHTTKTDGRTEVMHYRVSKLLMSQTAEFMTRAAVVESGMAYRFLIARTDGEALAAAQRARSDARAAAIPDDDDAIFAESAGGGARAAEYGPWDAAIARLLDADAFMPRDGFDGEHHGPAVVLPLTSAAAKAWAQFAAEASAADADGAPWWRRAAEQAVRVAGVLTLLEAAAGWPEGHRLDDTRDFGKALALDPSAARRPPVVTGDVMRAALAIVRWFMGEAEAVHSTGEVSAHYAAAERLRQTLVSRAERGALPEFITEAWVQKHGPAVVSTDDDKCSAVLDLLERRGWLISAGENRQRSQRWAFNFDGYEVGCAQGIEYDA